MTCVWDGLLMGLQKPFPSARPFVASLQEAAATYLKQAEAEAAEGEGKGSDLDPAEMDPTRFVTVTTAGSTEACGRQVRIENHRRVMEIDGAALDRGYDCSARDPVMILVAARYRCNIQLELHGTTCVYSVPSHAFTIVMTATATHLAFRTRIENAATAGTTAATPETKSKE